MTWSSWPSVLPIPGIPDFFSFLVHSRQLLTSGMGHHNGRPFFVPHFLLENLSSWLFRFACVQTNQFCCHARLSNRFLIPCVRFFIAHDPKGTRSNLNNCGLTIWAEPLEGPIFRIPHEHFQLSCRTTDNNKVWKPQSGYHHSKHLTFLTSLPLLTSVSCLATFCLLDLDCQNNDKNKMGSNQHKKTWIKRARQARPQ